MVHVTVQHYVLTALTPCSLVGKLQSKQQSLRYMLQLSPTITDSVGSFIEYLRMYLLTRYAPCTTRSKETQYTYNF